MGNNYLGRYATSFGASLAITSILSAILVVIKEESQNALLPLMKSLTGHHWVTHGLLAVVLFFLIGWGLGQTNARQGPKISATGLIFLIVGGVVVSGLIIAGFYLMEG